MRGKRIATPDLCRVEACTLSNATSNTSASRPRGPGRRGPPYCCVSKRSSSRNSSSVKPKYALPTGSPTRRLSARGRKCNRNRRTSACRCRAGHTSALRRRAADRASICTIGPAAVRRYRGSSALQHEPLDMRAARACCADARRAARLCGPSNGSGMAKSDRTRPGFDIPAIEVLAPLGQRQRAQIGVAQPQRVIEHADAPGLRRSASVSAPSGSSAAANR